MKFNQKKTHDIQVGFLVSIIFNFLDCEFGLQRLFAKDLNFRVGREIRPVSGILICLFSFIRSSVIAFAAVGSEIKTHNCDQ
jgi:hypothetical protein